MAPKLPNGSKGSCPSREPDFKTLGTQREQPDGESGAPFISLQITLDLGEKSLGFPGQKS